MGRNLSEHKSPAVRLADISCVLQNRINYQDKPKGFEHIFISAVNCNVRVGEKIKNIDKCSREWNARILTS